MSSNLNSNRWSSLAKPGRLARPAVLLLLVQLPILSGLTLHVITYWHVIRFSAGCNLLTAAHDHGWQFGFPVRCEMVDPSG